ncbi:MAG: hypothetical protein HS123_15675 [Solibacteraceae bacterium]|nr:hypothetical protein [Solibacteraceae bacterium]
MIAEPRSGDAAPVFARVKVAASPADLELRLHHQEGPLVFVRATDWEDVSFGGVALRVTGRAAWRRQLPHGAGRPAVTPRLRARRWRLKARRAGNLDPALTPNGVAATPVNIRPPTKGEIHPAGAVIHPTGDAAERMGLAGAGAAAVRLLPFRVSIECLDQRSARAIAA